MNTIDYAMIALGYVSGSIPVGMIIFYLIKRDDIRKYGSKSIGATNVLRNSSLLPGLTTFILDILKGYLPISACVWVGISFDSWTVTFVAIAAVLGHMFPIWLLFRGGKGVATGLGVFLALSWQSALLALAVFILTFVLVRIVSVGSIAGAASFIVFTFLLSPWLNIPFNIQIGALVIGLLIIAKHYENIIRLIKGAEKRISVSDKSSTEESAS